MGRTGASVDSMATGAGLMDCRSSADALKDLLNSLGAERGLLKLDKKALPALGQVLADSGLDKESIDKFLAGAAKSDMSLEKIFFSLSQLKFPAQETGGLTATEKGLPALGQFLSGLGASPEAVKNVMSGFQPGEKVTASALRDILGADDTGAGNLAAALSGADVDSLAAMLKSMGVTDEQLNGLSTLLAENDGQLTMNGFLGFLDSLETVPVKPVTGKELETVKTVMENVVKDQKVAKTPVFNEILIKLQALGGQDDDDDKAKDAPAPLKTDEKVHAPAIQALRSFFGLSHDTDSAKDSKNSKNEPDVLTATEENISALARFFARLGASPETVEKVKSFKPGDQITADDLKRILEAEGEEAPAVAAPAVEAPAAAEDDEEISAPVLTEAESSATAEAEAPAEPQAEVQAEPVQIDAEPPVEAFIQAEADEIPAPAPAETEEIPAPVLTEAPAEEIPVRPQAQPAQAYVEVEAKGLTADEPPTPAPAKAAVETKAPAVETPAPRPAQVETKAPAKTEIGQPAPSPAKAEPEGNKPLAPAPAAADARDLASMLKSMGAGEEQLGKLSAMLARNDGRISMNDFMEFIKSLPDAPAAKGAAGEMDIAKTLAEHITREQETAKTAALGDIAAKLQALEAPEPEADKFADQSQAFQSLRDGVSNIRGDAASLGHDPGHSGQGQHQGGMGGQNDPQHQHQQHQQRERDEAGAQYRQALHAAQKTEPTQAAAVETAEIFAGYGGDESLSKQISEKLVYNHRRGIHRLKMNLNPENMGRVDIELKVKGGRLVANIRAESREAYEALSTAIGGLKQSLADSGLELGNLTLSYDDEATGKREFADVGRAEARKAGRFDAGEAGTAGAPETGAADAAARQGELHRVA
jgi:hypothetical protein